MTKTNQKTTAVKPGDFKLSWSKNKTFELDITIPQAAVSTAYQTTLKKIAQDMTVDGFRKGKVPAKIAEEKIGQNKIYQEVVNLLVPKYYQDAIAKHNLRPIVNPKVEVVKMDEDKDWEIKLTACEAPEITLGDYKKIVQGAVAQDQIWVPGQDKDKAKDKSDDKSKKLNLILTALAKEVKVELADILVESERDRMLARLLEQIRKLGLTIEQYAQANNKTVESLQKEYHQLAQTNLTIEFIMQKIAQVEKLAVTDQEADDYLAQVKDDELKKQVNTPDQKAYLKLSLLRQKTIDFLLKI